MKIVSWNCNGALRKKLGIIGRYDADIYIIQECEDPKSSQSDEYKKWASNYLWVGANKNRGLGVFARSGISLVRTDLDAGKLELFLPCVVAERITLLAVWTKQANSPTFGYIGQFWKYLEKHKEFLRSKEVMVIGDFNSNVRWDVWDRWWNHSDVVRELGSLGLQSLYHSKNSEAQGEESQPTFYMYRKTEKHYHIDYVFLSEHLLSSASIEVGSRETWIEHSDHMPMYVQING